MNYFSANYIQYYLSIHLLRREMFRTIICTYKKAFMASLMFSMKTGHLNEYGVKSPTFKTDNNNCLINNKIYNLAGLEILPVNKQWRPWTTMIRSCGT